MDEVRNRRNELNNENNEWRKYKIEFMNRNELKGGNKK